MNTIHDFRQLLLEVSEKSKFNFSGLGILVYSDLTNLPIISLKHTDKDIHLPIKDRNEVVERLSLISSSNNKYHDGFHMLNDKLELTHLSQYVAATIIKDVIIKNEFGCRYRTAIYASALPNIICSGVLSSNYPATVFQNGKEVFSMLCL